MKDGDRRSALIAAGPSTKYAESAREDEGALRERPKAGGAIYINGRRLVGKRIDILNGWNGRQSDIPACGKSKGDA